MVCEEIKNTKKSVMANNVFRGVFWMSFPQKNMRKATKTLVIHEVIHIIRRVYIKLWGKLLKKMRFVKN